MCNRIMIAGTGSGCGKTTITCALLAALVSMGKDIISFKCGPDYIDPMFHKKVTGVESRNLDVFLMGEKIVKYSVACHAANRDIALIEGVMGIYDGLGSGSFASSNHVSVLTNTPAILIVNAKGAALSVCAMIKGFLEFDKNNIRGIILNNVPEAMFNYYQQMIKDRFKVNVIGFMPHIPEAQIESRHLGLITADEITDIKDKIRTLASNALKYIDIAKLLDIAGQEPLDGSIVADHGRFLLKSDASIKSSDSVKIYVACDEAFLFWYEDNHDLLKALGADIKFFSPVYDKELPEDADGLVLWGGYPELYSGLIQKNKTMKKSLNFAIDSGLPVYAEGGGFMFLHERLTDLRDVTYEMMGVLPGEVKMTDKLQNFGYYELKAQKDNLLCKAGDKINAHFFRRSISNNEGNCFKAVKQNGKTFPCIISHKNIFAGYQHLHFWGNPSFAENFVKACIKYKNRVGGALNELYNQSGRNRKKKF